MAGKQGERQGRPRGLEEQDNAQATRPWVQPEQQALDDSRQDASGGGPQGTFGNLRNQPRQLNGGDSQNYRVAEKQGHGSLGSAPREDDHSQRIQPAQRLRAFEISLAGSNSRPAPSSCRTRALH